MNIVKKFKAYTAGDGVSLREREISRVRKNYMAYKHQLLFFQKYFERWKDRAKEKPGHVTTDSGAP